MLHVSLLQKEPLVPERLSAQVPLYNWLPVVPGWMQVGDYQWGCPKLGLSPGLE